MKKFLLSLAAVAMGLTASAGTVTFNFAQNSYGAGPAWGGNSNSQAYVTNQNVATQGNVTVTFTGSSNTAWRFWSDGIRMYKNQSAVFTVNAGGQNITAISWTVSNNNATFAVEGTSNNITSWDGSAESVSLQYTNNDNNYALVTLTVTFDGEGGGDEPVDPNPGGGDDEPGDLTKNPVTFDFVSNDYGMTRGDNTSYNTNPTTISQYPISITFDGGNNRLWSDGMRFYKDSYFTISSTSDENPLVQVVVTYNNTTAANSFAFDGESDEYSVSGAVGTWNGNSDSITFKYTPTSSNQAVKSIVVTYYEEGKKLATTLSFSAASVTVSLNENDYAAMIPTLSNPNNVTVTYSSSNEDVATVDATSGAVTLIGDGQTTITATFEGDNTYEATSASYILTVIKPITGTLVFIDWSSNYPEDQEPTTETNNADGINIDTVTAADGLIEVSAAQNDAGTAPRWWYVAAGNQARFYAKNTLTFKLTDDNYQFTGIEFITKTNNFKQASSSNVGKFESGTWVPGSSIDNTEVVITFGENVYVTGTNVYYDLKSGVSDVVTDAEAAPVYYNLQGVRVANPEKGLYIVVKGNKTQKVIF